MFTDKVVIELFAGNGGNGVVAWRREKFIPKGGPSGGNGGKGGSVIIEADVQIPSLDWYRNRRLLKATNGGCGGPNNKQGKQGQDLILKVPCGTLLKDAQTGELIMDFTEDKQRLIMCKGGKGGLGNDFFKTSTNQAPNFSTPGKPGEERKVELELKLIADIGLVGFPNAGKSTFISTVADLDVKTAAYPFTTLKPNLGFVELQDQTRIFIADIPGIIEGAHNNRGLGFEFLRHIERTKMLLFVIDTSGIDGRNPADDFTILLNELEKYNPELLQKPYFVVLNKIDTDEAQENIPAFLEKHGNHASQIRQISAAGKIGTKELVQDICKTLHRALPVK